MVVKVLVLLAAMAVIAYMSLRGHYPESIEDIFNTVGSMLLHLVAYFGLALLFSFATGIRGRNGVFLALFFSFSYGLIMEVAQMWVPERRFSLLDILVNFMGAGLGALFIGYSEKARE